MRTIRFKKSAAPGGNPILLLWSHDTSQPIDVFQEIKETPRGLFVKGKLPRGVQKADEALKLLKAKAISGLSIGFRVPPDGASVDRKTGIRTLSTIELLEISIVAFPAADGARVSSVKSADPRFVERALRESGLSRKDSRGIVAHGVKTAAALRDAEDDAVRKMVLRLRAQTTQLNR